MTYYAICNIIKTVKRGTQRKRTLTTKYLPGKKHREREEKKMWEVVKTVKGYDITRMVGSRGAYHVSVREGKGFREFHTFKTIKAAVEFIETAL